MHLQVCLKIGPATPNGFPYGSRSCSDYNWFLFRGTSPFQANPDPRSAIPQPSADPKESQSAPGETLAAPHRWPCHRGAAGEGGGHTGSKVWRPWPWHMGLSDRVPLNPLVKSSFLHGFPMNITIIWGICRGFQAHPHGLRSVHFKHHSWHMLMTRTSLKVGCPLNCIIV